MAIDFDAASTLYDLSNSPDFNSPVTLSYTTGAGANRIIWIDLLFFSASDIVTSVTYGGAAATRWETVSYGTRRAYGYVLVAPASGANNIVITTSSNVAFYARVASYSGAAQTGQPDNHTHNSGTGITSITGTLTPVANNCWIHAFIFNDGTQTVTPNAGTTLRGSDNMTFGARIIGDSNGPITPAGSTALGYSWTGSTTGGIIIASFAPAATANGGAFLVRMVLGL